LPGYGTPAASPGYGTPAAYGAPGGYGLRPTFQPATWLLQLTSGARNLLTTFIALGTVFFIALVAIYAVAVAAAGGGVSDAVTALAADRTLTGAYTTLGKDLTSFGQDTENCNQNLACVTKLDGQVAGDLKTFSGQLASTRVPAGAAADKALVSADVNALTQDFTQLSRATTATQYESIVNSTGVEAKLNTFAQDVQTLDSNLTSY
jgi:hypothetical protein